jgi:hemerythrin-like domain-containing protein/quercetin dioxygenase-like cupin family protein
MSLRETGKAIQVCESLLAEHRVMEGLLLSLEKQLPAFSAGGVFASQKAEVQALLGVIQREMNVHFACEERALFPAVSPYHPMVLMEVEHEELIELRGELLSRFEGGRFAEFEASSRRFIEYMRDHIAREDGGIFPTCEQALSADEKRQVLDEMAQIRTNAKAEDIPAIIRPEKSFEPIRIDPGATLERPLMISLLAERPGLQVKHLSIRAGESLPAHWSPKRLLIWCVAGEAAFNGNQGEPVALSPGVGVLLDPQLNHAIHAQTDCHLLLLLEEVKP